MFIFCLDIAAADVQFVMPIIMMAVCFFVKYNTVIICFKQFLEF